ncbi:putative polyketide synthase [Burkholderia pseudomallei]|nr:putative polyketide synthase [Burkholderia pseudomallei]
MPAAASRCPMLPLTEPMGSAPARPSIAPSTRPSAFASSGSPSSVPVPCASTRSICSGATPAASIACRISASCAGALGAVIPFDWPL